LPSESKEPAPSREDRFLSGNLAAAGPESSGLPRSVEVLLAGAGLLAVSPILALAAVAIGVSSGLPVFFRQTRIGRNGRPFTLVKFRTMRVSDGGPQVTAGDDPRVTRVGRLLRRTKLDELPELWNVFVGDMSFVGPRPEVARYVNTENELWRDVLSARPGLTDPVTLRLRDEEDLMARVEGDREQFYVDVLQPMKLEGYRDYLRRRTWGSDLVVIWNTLRTLAGRRRKPNSPEGRAEY
jgi:lipopolysaccharide/colanic/teichoic acid biosynthesis glycosyltransferase